MFRRNITQAVIVLAIATGAATSYAGEPTGYYRDTQKGWWWGDRTVEEKPEEEEPPPAPKQEEKQNAKTPPELRAYNYKDVWDMHPDDFLEFQEAYKKKAVQNPTENNVKDYYELSEIARKKALSFQNTSQYVWQKYPELTTVKDYPVNTPGNLSRIGQISDEKQAVLRANRDDYGLIYFWEPGCSYCTDQKGILTWFEQQTNWSITHVNRLQNPALAAKVGVTMSPTIILIKKGSQEFFPVSAGVITSTEIEEKLYRAVRLLNGQITPQEYSIHEFQKGGGHDVNSTKDWTKTKGK